MQNYKYRYKYKFNYKHKYKYKYKNKYKYELFITFIFISGFKLYATSANKCQHCCDIMQMDVTCWAQQYCFAWASNHSVVGYINNNNNSFI